MASPFSSAWPDPNSSVLSKIDFGVPLVEVLKWLVVRDTFLGQNEKKQDITTALSLARDCKHPDAEWLTSIFEGKDVSMSAEAKKVLLAHQTNAHALCFAWHLTDERWEDFPILCRSSEMGNAFACSTLSDQLGRKNEEEAFRLVLLSAAHRERDGFYWLGCSFRDGHGCEKDVNLAKQNLLMAAELGHTWAAAYYGNMLDKSDPFRWLWWGRAALHGSPDFFLYYFSKEVEEVFSGSGNASIVFVIGRALKGNIDMEKKEIFGRGDFDSLISPSNQAVFFYDSQIKSARLAVETWTLVATRLHVIKDMRIYIGKMIWDARFEANYKG